jgi:hypothetical protein
LHTYLLGRHHGDLPTHLVGTEMDGHEVFAMAELDGPDHSVFVGLKRIGAAAGSVEPGARPMSGTLSTSGDPISEVVVFVQCLRDDCLGLLPELPISPCYLPGWDVIVFVIIFAEHLRDALPRARQHIGDGAVAAATDGGGRFLVELAANDRGSLEQALAELASLEGVDMRAAHWADGRAVARA